MRIKLAASVALAGVAWLACAWAAQTAERIRPAVLACRQIHTPDQLQKMKNNPADTYCLANDLDMSPIANFVPVGQTTPFTGQLFGNGHVIRNLTINITSEDYAALFAYTLNAVIEDVRLINVNITGGQGNTAALVALADGDGNGSVTRLSRIQVSGTVKCTVTGCLAGGIVAQLQGATLTDSSSSATVTGTDNAAGGAAAFADGTILRTYATGPIICPGTSCRIGGLVGAGNVGPITDSFAVGTVTAGPNANAGGLVGEFVALNLKRSFASGAVTGGTNARVGGLAGLLSNGTVMESYSVGPVTGGSGATTGGLIGSTTATVTNSYWDMQTSGLATSAAGTGKTTAELQQILQPGFSPAWGITKNLSYPFLNTSHIDYAAPLAMLVRSDKVFAFLPISQLDNSQYLNPPAHSDGAALATVYTMIGRAVGITDGVGSLKGNNAKIDRYFWHDATQTTTFNGPITSHATLGPLTNIAPAAHLSNGNVIGQMGSHRLVILRGTYTKSGGGTATHWMLGTLYTKVDADISVIANDPWTGAQVEIDPSSKTVTSPTGFPLTDFTVDGYQSVTVN